MQTVPLHGKNAHRRVALVDDDDYDLVMQYRWHLWETRGPGDRRLIPYARAYVPATGSRKRTMIVMHRLIMGTPGTDHVNHNGLDNRRENLRPATQSQNMGNRRKRLTASSSQYKGVSWHKRTARWRAAIRAGGPERHLGVFTSEADAARAYDTAAREAFGEFACVNFPQPGERGALELAGSESMTAPAPQGGGPIVPDRAGTSLYRGVYWESDSQRWRARFKRVGGGVYESEIQAAIAYDVLASAALGTAADLNFPDGVDQAARDRLYAEAGITVEEASSAVGRGRSASLRATFSRREYVTLVCELCGSEYPSKATNAGRYCGRSCQDKAAYARNRESRRVTLPREQAEKAARVYAEAVAAGKRGATRAVAAELGFSRSHASRMIRAARDLGLLGDALSGRPG